MSFRKGAKDKTEKERQRKKRNKPRFLHFVFFPRKKTSQHTNRALLRLLLSSSLPFLCNQSTKGTLYGCCRRREGIVTFLQDVEGELELWQRHSSSWQCPESEAGGPLGTTLLLCYFRIKGSSALTRQPVTNVQGQIGTKAQQVVSAILSFRFLRKESQCSHSQASQCPVCIKNTI